MADLVSVFKNLWPQSQGSVLERTPIPAPQKSFGEDMFDRQLLQAVQQADVRQQLQQQHQRGLETTLGPMWGSRAIGQMGAIIGGPPTAVAVGEDLGHGLENLVQTGNPKSLAFGLMSLPLLLGMAAQSKSPAARGVALTEEQASRVWQRLSENPKALKLFQELDPAADTTTILRNLVDAPVEDYVKIISGSAKQSIAAQMRKEGLAQNKQAITVGSINNEAQFGQNLVQRETFTRQGIYDKLVEDPKMWAKFDLSDPVEARSFRTDLTSELAATTQRPQEKLKAINREVAQKVMERGVKIHNEWVQLEAKRIKAAGTNEPIPKTITANFKLRDKYQNLLDTYFNEPNVSPSRQFYDATPSYDRPVFNPSNITTPEKAARLREISAEMPVYKTQLVRNEALKKFFTGAASKMSQEEYMALLDLGVQSSAQQIIKFTQSKRDKLRRKE